MCRLGKKPTDNLSYKTLRIQLLGVIVVLCSSEVVSGSQRCIQVFVYVKYQMYF